MPMTMPACAPSKTTTTSSLCAMSLARYVILKNNVDVAIAEAPVEENILPRHVALVMAQGRRFSIYVFIFSSEN